MYNSVLNILKPRQFHTYQNTAYKAKVELKQIIGSQT